MRNLEALLILFCSIAAVSAEQTNLEVDSAYVRGMPPGRDVTAAFFEVTNHQKVSCKLTNIDTPIAKRAEIHNHLHENGMMKMRQIDSVTISAGETVVFEPGGLHVMLFGVQPLTDAANVELTLHFEDCGSLPVTARVRSARD